MTSTRSSPPPAPPVVPRRRPSEWEAVHLMELQFMGAVAAFDFVRTKRSSQALSLAATVGMVTLMGGIVYSLDVLARHHPFAKRLRKAHGARFDAWLRMCDDAGHTAQKVIAQPSPRIVRGTHDPLFPSGRYRVLYYNPKSDRLITGVRRGYKVEPALRLAFRVVKTCRREYYKAKGLSRMQRWEKPADVRREIRSRMRTRPKVARKMV